MPLVVPEKPPAMYPMTVNYCPINSPTVKNTWLMPRIDAVLQDMRDSEAIAMIYFTSKYCYHPMEPESQSLHAFMTLDDVMQETRTAQGGCNSAASFQACVELCFSVLRDNSLSWPDDFALHIKTENGRLRVVERFLAICMEYRLVLSLPKSLFFATKVN